VARARHGAAVFGRPSLRGHRAMTTVVRSPPIRHRFANRAVGHIRHQRDVRLGSFFRGLLIGAALIIVISLVIG
jgi:hypothetical protein